MHELDEERNVIQHANGFLMIKTMVFERGHDRYFFPRQCENVFYSKVLGERDWSFFVIYDPRGRPLKYTIEEEYDIEEEDDASETEKEDGLTDDEDDKDVVLDDDVDENMIENDIDDDDDIINPFSIVFEPNDDTNFELDEEEYIEEG
jgi:hypothetical protein